MGLAFVVIPSLPAPGVRLLSTFGHDWGADDVCPGSWATYRPGTVARFNDELPRQEGHVFFALTMPRAGADSLKEPWPVAPERL